MPNVSRTDSNWISTTSNASSHAIASQSHLCGGASKRLKRSDRKLIAMMSSTSTKSRKICVLAASMSLLLVK
jgi:hypothetical protein